MDTPRPLGSVVRAAGCKSSLAVRITQWPGTGAPINLGQAAPAENPKGANSAVRKREAGVGGMNLLSEEAADQEKHRLAFGMYSKAKA